MKKVICSLFVIYLTLYTVNAQKNIISLTFQPTDLGVGLRYDKLFCNNGIYTSVSYGNYRIGESYLKDHYKISIGCSIPVEDNFLNCGVSYHQYGERYGEINKKALAPISFDIGGGVFIKKWMVGFRFDLLKGEGSVDIGIRL